MPERLSVLHVVLSLSPGGTERLVIEMCRRSRHEFDTAVCCLDTEGAWAGELRDEGIAVYTLGRRPGFRPALSRGIARLAAAHGVDVLHCHHYTPYVYGLLAALQMRSVGLVFTEHGRLSDRPPTAKRRLVNPLLARMPGEIFAVSHDLARHMAAEGFPSYRIGVIHNGIDIGPAPGEENAVHARTTLGLEPGNFVVGTVGRLDPVKDFTSLLLAFATAARSHWRLVLIGDGPEDNTLRQLARDLGIDARVRFLGLRQDVRELLPAFDVFANSSVHEGVSLTILEAMATALPVVATRVGGTPEVVEDGRTGVLVPSRMPEALALALNTLAASPSWRAELGAAAYRRAAERFTVDGMLEAYARAYRRQASRLEALAG